MLVRFRPSEAQRPIFVDVDRKVLRLTCPSHLSVRATRAGRLTAADDHCRLASLDTPLPALVEVFRGHHTPVEVRSLDRQPEAYARCKTTNSPEAMSLVSSQP
eukprot:6204807-Pleurochrysis_carterae.AAC.1